MLDMPTVIDYLKHYVNVSQPASFGRNDYSMWNISLDNMKPIFQRLIKGQCHKI